MGNIIPSSLIFKTVEYPGKSMGKILGKTITLPRLLILGPLNK